jgi:hypothetical protein
LKAHKSLKLTTLAAKQGTPEVGGRQGYDSGRHRSQVECGMVSPKADMAQQTPMNTKMSPEANMNRARRRQWLAYANAHELQVYGLRLWNLSEHPIVSTTTSATALECVLSESNPNRRAVFGGSCLMNRCQRPTFFGQHLPKTTRLVSANILTRSYLMQLLAARAEQPNSVILAGGWLAPYPLASPLSRGLLELS